MRNKLNGGLMLAALLMAGVRTVSAMGETGAVSFLTGENAALSAVTDSSHTFAYFGTRTEVAKVRLTDLTLISTATVFADATSATLDNANAFAYFGSSTAPGRVGRLRVSNETASYITLPAGEDYLTSVVIDSASLYAYFGTNTSPGIVSKVGLSPFGRVDAKVLDAGESYLKCAVMDPVNGFAYFGTETNPAKVIKIRLSNFTKEATLSLPGESNLTSAVISTATGFAYFGTNTDPGKIIKIRLSNFTKESSIQLIAGETNLTSAVIDPSSAFAYFGTNTTPGKVIRLQLSNFIETYTTTLAAGENGLLSAVMDPLGTFAFFGTNTSPAQVVRLDLVDTRTGPPIINSQPSDAVVNPGGTASFFVGAAGTVPFTYQWLLNGVTIPGATSPGYTTGALTFTDNGSTYSCAVTNSLGTTVSRAARLSMKPVIKVFPNPWRSDIHGGLPMTFEGAAPNSTLKIFTLSMHWVKSVTGQGVTPLTWDRTNDAGQRVASGYYFFLVTTGDDEQTVHGKLAIIK